MISLILSLAAVTGDEPGSVLVRNLAACRTIARDEERLACYDRAAAAVVEAEKSKTIVVLDRAEVQKTKRSLFGFSLPSIRLFGDGKDDEQLKQLVGTLQAPQPLPGGLLRFTIEGGGMWETTEQAVVPFRRGDTVTIKAGSLGSYVATAPGRRAVRVRRLR